MLTSASSIPRQSLPTFSRSFSYRSGINCYQYFWNKNLSGHQLDQTYIGYYCLQDVSQTRPGRREYDQITQDCKSRQASTSPVLSSTKLRLAQLVSSSTISVARPEPARQSGVRSLAVLCHDYRQFGDAHISGELQEHFVPGGLHDELGKRRLSGEQNKLDSGRAAERKSK